MKKFETFKRLWSLCAPYHWYLVSVLLFLLAGQLLIAVFPIIFGSLVTALTAKDAKAFIVSMCILTVLSCMRTGIFYFRERMEIKNLEYELSRYLSRVSMKKFFEISMGQHHVGHSFIKKSVINKGETAVGGIIFMSIYDLIPTCLMIVLPLCFLLVKIPIVGLCVLLIITCFLAYTIKFNLRYVSKIRKLDSLSNVISKKQGEVIQNADLVYVNAQEERVRRECDEENEKQGVAGKPVWLSYINWFFSGQWFVALSQAACVALCGYLVYKGEIGSGLFITAYMWISSALGTLGNISNLQRNLTKNIAPINKYFGFLDYEPDIIMPVKPIAMESLRGRIEFRNVSFAYRSRNDKDSLNDDDLDEDDDSDSKEPSEEIPAIKEVSFILDEGRRYAFVGKSGAGKSTLVGLILRAFDPQGGHVLIDGVDMRMLDYRDLRRKIGLVPQDVSLFDGTIRYNITFGLNGAAEKVTDEELNHVAKLARISEFSDKLEKGWETKIGERGIKLSGGQRQRIGIGRALIKNPHILIFDEATSSLDTENEARIRDSIKEASVGKTTIIIAHRLATVRDADKIFVFDEGKIVGQGSHKELLKTNEYYQRLVHNQVIMS